MLHICQAIQIPQINMNKLSATDLLYIIEI